MVRKWTYDGNYTVEEGCYAVAAIHETTGLKADEARANAHLIAAAPDLLSALERVVACAVDPRSPAMDAARLAIARAKGVSA